MAERWLSMRLRVFKRDILYLLCLGGKNLKLDLFSDWRIELNRLCYVLVDFCFCGLLFACVLILGFF